MNCDACGKYSEELKEMKFFGNKNYYCRDCMIKWKND